jgi:hypothetical protein
VTERSDAAERDRNESQPERLDRNTVELLNELRVAGAGIQVMFAFLLVLPFNKGWTRVDSFERTVYFVTLLVVAVAAFLLMAPPIHHRLLFRARDRGCPGGGDRVGPVVRAAAGAPRPGMISRPRQLAMPSRWTSVKNASA